ncbi:hypothetical protein AMJ86_09470 [bacterium SM23_57]|nr:MAG: hypothetical protein AMJ86_09470 [bacterium SM23_57]
MKAVIAHIPKFGAKSTGMVVKRVGQVGFRASTKTANVFPEILLSNFDSKSKTHIAAKKMQHPVAVSKSHDHLPHRKIKVRNHDRTPDPKFVVDQKLATNMPEWALPVSEKLKPVVPDVKQTRKEIPCLCKEVPCTRVRPKMRLSLQQTDPPLQLESQRIKARMEDGFQRANKEDVQYTTLIEKIKSKDSAPRLPAQTVNRKANPVRESMPFHEFAGHRIAKNLAYRIPVSIKGVFLEPAIELPGDIGWKISLNQKVENSITPEGISRSMDTVEFKTELPGKQQANIREIPVSSKSEVPHLGVKAPKKMATSGKVVIETNGNNGSNTPAAETKTLQHKAVLDTAAKAQDNHPSVNNSGEFQTLKMAEGSPVPIENARTRAVKDRGKAVSKKQGGQVKRVSIGQGVGRVSRRTERLGTNPTISPRLRGREPENHAKFALASDKSAKPKWGIQTDNARSLFSGVLNGLSAQAIQSQPAPSPTTGRWDNLIRFVEKVMRNARVIHRAEGTSELQVKLASKSLGRVLIQLSVTDNHVDVKFAFDSIQAKQVLQNNRSELAQLLKDSGATTVNIDVSTSSADGGDRNRQSAEARDRSNNPPIFGGLLGEDSRVDANQWDSDDNLDKISSRMYYPGGESSMVWVA